MHSLLEKLSVLEAEGIIEKIDLEFCRFLQQLDPGISQEVLKAACLTSYSFRQGDVCISLEKLAGDILFENSDLSAPAMDKWMNILRESPIVGAPGEFKPLILDSSRRLYLHKLWQYEQTLAANILAKTQRKAEAVDYELLRNGIIRLFGEHNQETDWQRIAAVSTVINSVTVISGGPGTGKTTTIVRVLALLLEQYMDKDLVPDIALAAPTGKAAARLKDAVVSSKEKLEVAKEIKEQIPTEAVTIHQLLGARRNSAQFRYNAENPLPYDIVIIDEASMVDQALMSKLMQALLTETKLILIGDKDQLASVEAGSVLGSICALNRNQVSPGFADRLNELSIKIPESAITEERHPLTDNIILLEKNYRFGAESGISQLAGLINRGKADDAVSLLESAAYNGIELAGFKTSEDFENELRKAVKKYVLPILSSQESDRMFDMLKTFRILSPHRTGPFGVEYLNNKVKDILIRDGAISRYETWYHGKPVIINQNDYGLGLHNGDIGICIINKGEKNICFQKDDGYKEVVVSRLPDYDPAYVLTVHKSQGSEFDDLLLVLPAGESKVMTRELLYTAITRARSSVKIFGGKEILKKGIATKLERFSGLRDSLWNNRTNNEIYRD